MNLNQEMADEIITRTVFEKRKTFIRHTKNPIIILEKLNDYANDGLRTYNKNQIKYFNLLDALYQICKNRAIELEIDVSKYLGTLEELTE